MGAPRACEAEAAPIRLETVPLRPADLIRRNFGCPQAVGLVKSAACSALP